MESEKGKLFVANLKTEVTENHLITYFSRYGKVTDALVIRHKGTTISKGFGFVTFDDPAVAATVLDEGNHMILGQKVDVQKAKPKSQQRLDVNDGIGENPNNRNHSDDDDKNNNSEAENSDNFMDSDGGHAKVSRKKIFVGGLPPNITKEELAAFFGTFGAISDVVVIHHKETKRPRGFGFVTFESEETAAMVLRNKFYKLDDHNVEVKRAEPKITNSYNNLVLGNGSEHPYCYCDFYRPIGNPYYQPSSLCASCGILYPTYYYCASQYSIYNAQLQLNCMNYNGGGEHMRLCYETESPLDNLASPQIGNYIAEADGAEQEQ